jgi:heme-degrading monooxygenase HmoA
MGECRLTVASSTAQGLAQCATRRMADSERRTTHESDDDDILSRETCMSAYELAQLNIGVIKGPIDSPVMADFVANLDRINTLAERTPGFVWRLQTEEGNATSIRPYEDERVAVNMSVWRDVESLNKYVYSSEHVQIMRRRREWFEKMDQAFLVLWWVPRGHRPSVEEGKAKLEKLRSKGPTAEAFTFRQAFPPPDAGKAQSPVSFGDKCPAT